MYFPELGTGWSVATLKREVQFEEFLNAAMKYVVNREWTYFIGGSTNDHINAQVTPFGYCASEYSIDDPGFSYFYGYDLNDLLHAVKYFSDISVDFT